MKMSEQIRWGLPIAVYLFLGGMAAAAYYIGVIADLTGRDRYRNVARLGSYAVFAPICIGLVMLLFDLGQPSRFWHLIFQTGPINSGLILRFGSAMSLGAWLLTAFVVICGLLYPAMWLAEEKAGKNLPLISGLAGREKMRRNVGIIGLPLALLVAVYTGVLLAATSEPVWANTPLLPMLFVISATSTGIAAIIFLMGMSGTDDPHVIGRLEKGDSLLIKMELALVILLFIALMFSPEAAGLIKNVMIGSYAVFFWLGVIGVGLLLPLSIQRYSRQRHSQVTTGLALMSSVLVLCGGFFLRYVILLAA